MFISQISQNFYKIFVRESTGLTLQLAMQNFHLRFQIYSRCNVVAGIMSRRCTKVCSLLPTLQILFRLVLRLRMLFSKRHIDIRPARFAFAPRTRVNKLVLALVYFQGNLTISSITRKNASIMPAHMRHLLWQPKINSSTHDRNVTATIDSWQCEFVCGNQANV